MKLTGYHWQQTDTTVTNDMQTTRFDAHTIFLPRFTSDCPMKSLKPGSHTIVVHTQSGITQRLSGTVADCLRTLCEPGLTLSDTLRLSDHPIYLQLSSKKCHHTIRFFMHFTRYLVRYYSDIVESGYREQISGSVRPALDFLSGSRR